jgi:hypothetical protein
MSSASGCPHSSIRGGCASQTCSPSCRKVTVFQNQMFSLGAVSSKVATLSGRHQHQALEMLANKTRSPPKFQVRQHITPLFAYHHTPPWLIIAPSFANRRTQPRYTPFTNHRIPLSKFLRIDPIHASHGRISRGRVSYKRASQGHASDKRVSRRRVPCRRASYRCAPHGRATDERASYGRLSHECVSDVCLIRHVYQGLILHRHASQVI